VSDSKQGLYRAFVSPFVRGAMNDQTAEWLREMHPARLQYSLFSDRNPFMAWTAAAAEQVRSDRRPAADDNPLRAAERQVSDGIVASLDAWRDTRDQTQEQLFFGIYDSDLLQTLLGMKSSSEDRRGRKAARDPAHEALIHEKIAELKRRIGLGGPREAFVRSLIYAGLPDGRIDERGFGALKRIREQAPDHERMSLSELKQLLREQFLMLLVDEKAALDALPGLLPDDQAARKELYDLVLSVLTVVGPPSEIRRTRLDHLAQRFGLDAAAGDVELVPIPGKAKGAPAAAAPKRRRRATVRS